MKLTLSMRMLAFHFLEAALPETRSNSVGLTTCPFSIWTALRCVRKVPRMELHTTRTLDGALAAFCDVTATSVSDRVTVRVYRFRVRARVSGSLSIAPLTKAVGLCLASEP